MPRPARSSIAVTGLALLLAPALLFPHLIPEVARTPVAGTVAMGALAASVLILRSPALALVTLGLGVSAIIGWQRAGPSLSSLAHFTGLSAGLLLMSVVGTWCRTEARVLLVLCGALSAGTAALIGGFFAMNLPGAKLFGMGLVVRDVPVVVLSVPGLDAGHVNPNALGAAALLVLPLAGAAIRAGRRTAAGLGLPVLSAVAATVSGFVILVSQSRSAWIAVWLLLVVAGVRFGTQWRPRVLAVALLIVLTVAGVMGVQRLDGAAFDRTVSHARATIVKRKEILGQGISALRRAPWFGIGLNEFRHRYEVKPHNWPVAHAHNVMLQTALDIGLIGLAWYGTLLTMLLVWADRLAHRAPPVIRYTAAGAALSILGVHFFGIADAVALGAKVGGFQWLAAGLIVAAHGLSQSLERPQAPV